MVARTADSFFEAPASVDAMIQEADALMYGAKDLGKDRIESDAVGRRWRTGSAHA
jgi:hypothetical protein